MDNRELKRGLLALVRQIRVEIEELLGELTPEQREQSSSLEQWSAKDMLVHLVFWGVHFNSQGQAGQAGGKIPQVGDYYDLVNDGLIIRHADTPFQEARDREEETFQQAINLLDNMDADTLCNPRAFAWLEGRSLLDRALGACVWHVLAHISDFYRALGQIEKAVQLQEIYTEKMRAFPVWDANAPYNLACFYAQNHFPEKAVRCLETAFRARPDLKEWARQDTDLDPLRTMPKFTALLGD